MARYITRTEANRQSGLRAAVKGKHGSRVVGLRYRRPAPPVLRMPPQYAPRDIELLLDALWGMFTQRQAEELVVTVPWDDADQPRQVRLAEFAVLLESWLG